MDLDWIGMVWIGGIGGLIILWARWALACQERYRDQLKRERLERLKRGPVDVEEWEAWR
jgi:hypothetical protein